MIATMHIQTGLISWITDLTVRRLDSAQRDFVATQWSDGYGHEGVPAEQLATNVHGANVILDEWALMEKQGFYQHPETKQLRILPLVVYPGKIIAPWVTAATDAPVNKALWLVIEHRLVPVLYPALTEAGLDHTGWGGQIAGTSARLEWGQLDPRPNQIFPSVYSDSMPPNNLFIWHARLGQTDGAGNYSLLSDIEPAVCGQYSPPYHP